MGTVPTLTCCPRTQAYFHLTGGTKRAHRDQQYVLDVTSAPEDGAPLLPSPLHTGLLPPAQGETYVVIGVQDTRDILSQVAVQNSLDVATNVDWRTEVGTGSGFGQAWLGRGCLLLAAELTVLEVEVIGGLGRPQAHGVNDVVAVARHRCVIWHGQHHLQGHPVGIRSWASAVSPL